MVKIILSLREISFMMGIFALIFISVGVYAYNTNNPSVMGHTMGEIQSSCTGLLRWTGSEWACISMPPTCTEETQGLTWTGSAWQCKTLN